MSKTFYVVVSPSPELYQDSEQLVMALPNTSLIIKEYGVDGNHPHLNILMESRKRIDSLKRSLHSKFRKKNPEFVNQTHLLALRGVSYPQGLIGGYLQKEQGFDILKNDGHDLQKYKRNEKKVQEFRTKASWLKVPTFLEFPLFYIEYCESKHYKVREQNFTDILGEMLRDGIAVHHLYKKLEDLEHAIITLTAKKNFLD